MEGCAVAWNVLAEGPSIKRLRVSDLLDGPVVAINDAVRLPVPVHYWAVIDPVSMQEGNVFARNAPHLRPPLKVWVPERRLRFWDRLELPEGVTLEPHPRDLKATQVKGSWDQMAEQLSIFMSIAECARHGAKRIKVFGADMRGQGNAILGWKEEERQQELDRWSNERAKFVSMVAQGAERGVKIERWVPA